MELTPNEAIQRLNLLGFINLTDIAQSTRVKIIRHQVDYERIINLGQNDVQEGLKKIKPEGFDESLQKFEPVISPKEETADQAETLKTDPDYNTFKETYDKVNAEYGELYQKVVSENKYKVNVPIFNDADLDNIATVLPSGQTTKKEVNGEKQKVLNDLILKAIIATF